MGPEFFILKGEKASVLIRHRKGLRLLLEWQRAMVGMAVRTYRDAVSDGTWRAMRKANAIKGNQVKLRDPEINGK